MHKSKVCCSMFLVSFLAGILSGNGNVRKYGCHGSCIKLVDSASHEESNTVVSIYNLDNVLLGIWHKSSEGNLVRKNGQNERLISDKKGNIWINNVIDLDNQVYIIKSDIRNTSKKENVTLTVMAAPTKECKPKIIRSGDLLIAELSSESNDECGRPLVSVHWLEHPGRMISRQSIKVHSGWEKHVYHACIKGLSLACANQTDVMDFCSIYIQSEANIHKDTIIAISNTVTCCLTFFIAFIVFTRKWICQKLKKNPCLRTRRKEYTTGDEGTKSEETNKEMKTLTTVGSNTRDDSDDEPNEFDTGKYSQRIRNMSSTTFL